MKRSETRLKRKLSHVHVRCTLSYLSVLKVSSKLMSAGLIAAIMAVFELPPVGEI